MTSVGNHLALDLVNTRTVGPHGERDALGDYANLVDWLAGIGVIPSSVAERVRLWDGTPGATRAFAAVCTIREAALAVARAFVAGASPSAETIAAINEQLGRPIATDAIGERAGRLVRDRVVLVDAPEDLVIPLAEAARDLVLEANPALVRQCAASNCIRWFYDTSKRHARSWCDMRSCGNRMKAAALRERRRASAENAGDPQVRRSSA